MVEFYNTRADAQGLEPHEMRAVCALTELGAQDRFDLVVVRYSFLIPHQGIFFAESMT